MLAVHNLPSSRLLSRTERLNCKNLHILLFTLRGYRTWAPTQRKGMDWGCLRAEYVDSKRTSSRMGKISLWRASSSCRLYFSLEIIMKIESRTIKCSAHVKYEKAIQHVIEKAKEETPLWRISHEKKYDIKMHHRDLWCWAGDCIKLVQGSGGMLWIRLWPLVF
jgi:hypothetical protein